MYKWLGECAAAGFSRFYFVDNTFNLPPSYARMLCSKLVEANLDITWRCILYPVKIDEELVRLMAEAGCTEVSLGFESGHELLLHGMNRRFKLDDVRHTSELLGKYRHTPHGVPAVGWAVRNERNRLRRALHLRTL